MCLCIPFVKLRLGALIPRSVCRSVGLSVLQKLQKITKLYKTLQNITKHWETIKYGSSTPFNVWKLSRKLRHYAGAFLTESSFFLFYKVSRVWNIFKRSFYEDWPPVGGTSTILFEEVKIGSVILIVFSLLLENMTDPHAKEKMTEF